MVTGMVMEQRAPYPVILEKLVWACKYRPGWEFVLNHEDRGQGSIGLTLNIIIKCQDTYHPETPIFIRHSHIVPAAAYDERSWRRWLFERILEVACALMRRIMVPGMIHTSFSRKEHYKRSAPVISACSAPVMILRRKARALDQEAKAHST